MTEEQLRDYYETKTDKLLTELCIPRYFKGFSYLKEAIVGVLCDSRFPGYVGRSIYAPIAERGGTTVPRVERDIRHAVAAAWEKGSVTLLRDHFGRDVGTVAPRPSNTRFIRAAVKAIGAFYARDTKLTSNRT